MEYVIRKRNKEDIKDVERVVTLGWNQTYKGLVSDGLLDYIREHESDRVKKRLEDFNDEENDYIVLEVDGKVVGFAKYGVADYDGYGELFALYVLKEYHGHGFGKLLVQEVSKILKMRGFNKMVIGCLVGNPSNEFYKHLGGVLKEQKTSVRLNEEMTDNVYEFNI